MRDYEIKGLKHATFLRGYFFDKELPPLVREALDHLCSEYESLIADVNHMVEADFARQEEEKRKKRAERENKKEPLHVINVSKENIPPGLHIEDEIKKDQVDRLIDEVAAEFQVPRHMLLGQEKPLPNFPCKIEPVFETSTLSSEIQAETNKHFTQKGHPNYTKGNPENVWEKWQDDKLIEMKSSANNHDTIASTIAKAVNKTSVQVNNRWYALTRPDGSGKRVLKDSKPASTPIKAIQRPDTSPERLIANHNQFAGKRDPQQPLRDEDWPDVRDMLDKKRLTVGDISDAYDVPFKTMQDFIAGHRRMDELLKEPSKGEEPRRNV